MNLSKIFTSKITLILSFILLAVGLIAGVTLIRYPQILFPEAAQCLGTDPFSLYCTWNTVSGAVSYHYQINDTTSSPSLNIASGETTDPWTEFPAYANHQYTCDVKAVNSCGNESSVATGPQPPFSCTAPTSGASAAGTSFSRSSCTAPN